MSEDGERLIDEKEFEEQERNLRMEVSNLYDWKKERRGLRFVIVSK